MELINETEVKRLINDNKIAPKGEIRVTESQLFTPSAIEYLNDKNIRIVKSAAPISKEEKRYETVFGGVILNKPEHMTHLRGNILVFKDHPVIKYRGVLDHLESEIVYAQTIIDELGYMEIVNELEEIIKLVRLLIKSEITGERLGEYKLIGLSADELREHSHHSTKHYGISHFLPSYKQGKVVALLNRLRTITRKAELVAYNAFKDANKNVERNDIIQSLNRLSSALWIMMCKFLAGLYKKD